ncbi:MAG TPA: hypothetical protein VNZ55_12230 [Thermomicrobiales bacterium]|nr:hypothetical protein [Thermomicrobiales bacterium]
MKRPLSQLVYARIQESDRSPRVITLHDHNQHGRDGEPYARAAAPEATIIGLESYKGVFVGKEIVGYTWFVGPNDRPSPLFFGDALAEIERFLWDEIDRQAADAAELPFLIGVGQGAIMALAAAAAVPDLLSGVIAVRGRLPVVPGWEPPLAPLDDLPILLFDDGRPRIEGVLSGDELIATLTRWGGSVQSMPYTGDEIPTQEMASWIRARTPRFRSSGS